MKGTIVVADRRKLTHEFPHAANALKTLDRSDNFQPCNECR